VIDIRSYLSAERVTKLKSVSKQGAIMELVALTAKSPAVEDAEKLQEAIFEREGIMTTGIGLEIAIPHAKIPSVKEFVVAVGTAPDGIDFDSYDGQPVKIVVLIAGPSQDQQRYLRILARVTLGLKSESVRQAVLDAGTPEEVVEVLVTAHA
jgi:mannitol/fructose-specific phosphotransferase system IIA component (Ntr-type)